MLCEGKSDLGEYKGCYIDKEERDLDIRISAEPHMTAMECFEAGLKTKGVKFVGLQFGGQCWGGKTFGKYGKVDDKECDHVCVSDPEIHCGGFWRNSIYDLSEFVSLEDPCSDPPKDCSTKGGYDKDDECKQTCANDVKIAKCEDKCF